MKVRYLQMEWCWRRERTEELREEHSAQGPLDEMRFRSRRATEKGAEYDGVKDQASACLLQQLMLLSNVSAETSALPNLYDDPVKSKNFLPESR